MFKIALCDDNKEFLKQERYLIEEHLSSLGEKFEISEFSSGVELVTDGDISSYDLIMLDYEMEHMTGFEVAKLIRDRSDKISLAFVTAFYEFSRGGYKFDAIRYLIKQEPQFESELCECINKAIRIKNKRNKKVLFSFIGKSVNVDIESIVNIRSQKHYLIFYVLENGNISEYRLREQMRNVYDKLISDAPNMFSIVRTGQLVNLRYVNSVDRRGFIRVSCNNGYTELFQTSDSRKKGFISDWIRYIGEETNAASL